MTASKVNGTAEPTQENLVKIADIFDVSVDYLLGRKEL
ncbi:MAG: helix-turn-helix domain-containing protein [Clostridia bacterium]|nr:helix-turn-helix domain-containing protein [Clostridia bacterium]